MGNLKLAVDNEAANKLICNAVNETLKVAAPGIHELIRHGIATSVALKLKGKLIVPGTIEDL